MNESMLQQLLDRLESLEGKFRRHDIGEHGWHWNSFEKSVRMEWELNDVRFRKVGELLAHRSIIETVLRLGAALDEQDWVGVKFCLAPELDTDYSSFRGTPPTRLSADEFVALRKVALTGLRTQHLSLNHLVSIQEDEATCRTDCVIHRWPTDDQDRRFFHSYGFYRYGLVRIERNWLIKAITQVIYRSEGDSTLHGAMRSADQ